MKRTKDERTADDMDREIYRLLGIAEAMAMTNKRWRETTKRLTYVRMEVRRLMHEKDREATI